MSDKKPAVLHLKHAPITLRVDDMVRGEVGEVAKWVADIPLRRGRNEVDPDLWAKWKERNKGSSFLELIREEKTDDEGPKSEDRDDAARPGPGRGPGAEDEQP